MSQFSLGNYGAAFEKKRQEIADKYGSKKNEEKKPPPEFKDTATGRGLASVGSSKGENVLDVGADALTASGQPIAMAAGAGLKTFSLIRKAKDRQRQEAKEAENMKRKRQIRAMESLTQVASGLRL